MDAELKAKWVEALRSGEYLQAQEELVETAYTDEGEPGKVCGFCCLGVFERAVLNLPIEDISMDDCSYDEKTGYELLDGYIPADMQQECIRLNDKEGKSFIEIADYIETHL